MQQLAFWEHVPEPREGWREPERRERTLPSTVLVPWELASLSQAGQQAPAWASRPSRNTKSRYVTPVLLRWYDENRAIFYPVKI